MKPFRDGQWWLVLVPLLVGHLALFGLWVAGGGLLGLAFGGGEPAAFAGALAGALAWWSAGTALDWLGYRLSARVTRGRWQLTWLNGALAGWTLPLIVLAIPALLGAVCWGLTLAAGRM